MDAKFRRPGLEDEPTLVGVDVGPAEHITKERPRRLGVVGVNQRVNTSDHETGA
jgi:hypothetical protein